MTNRILQTQNLYEKYERSEAKITSVQKLVTRIKFTQGFSGEPNDCGIQIKQKPKSHSPLKVELTYRWWKQINLTGVLMTL